MTGLAREVGLPDGRPASGGGGRVFIVEKEAECILLTSNFLGNSALCLSITDSLVRTVRNTSQRLLSCSNSDCSELEICNQTSVARSPEGPEEQEVTTGASGRQECHEFWENGVIVGWLIVEEVLDVSEVDSA